MFSIQYTVYIPINEALCLSIHYRFPTSHIPSPNQVKASQSYLYSPISQITNLSQGALQPVQHVTPSILRPSIQIRKNSPQKTFNREKWKKPQEEQKRHAIDVMCTEQTNMVKFKYGQVRMTNSYKIQNV